MRSVHHSWDFSNVGLDHFFGIRHHHDCENDCVESRIFDYVEGFLSGVVEIGICLSVNCQFGLCEIRSRCALNEASVAA